MNTKENKLIISNPLLERLREELDNMNDVFLNQLNRGSQNLTSISIKAYINSVIFIVAELINDEIPIMVDNIFSTKPVTSSFSDTIMETLFFMGKKTVDKDFTSSYRVLVDKWIQLSRIMIKLKYPTVFPPALNLDFGYNFTYISQLLETITKNQHLEEDYTYQV